MEEAKKTEEIKIFVANKGGCGKTLFSLVSILHGYFEGKKVAAIDLNFENPDTATILHGIVEGSKQTEAPVVNEGTPLAYKQEKINERLYAIRPHPLYHHDFQVLTFLDQFLYTNNGKFDLILIDTGLNLANLIPTDLKGERWPRSRASPTIYMIYTWSSGLRPWEMEAFDETIEAMRAFFSPDFDKHHLIHVLNPQAFIPKSLKANLKYLYRAKYQFDGADKMVSHLKKLGKKKGTYRAVPWETFRKEILLEVRNEFWRRPLGEFYKDEVPSIWLDVMNGFLKEHEEIPTNVFFHPYVYHQVQLIVDDFIIRRGKDLEDMKDLVEPVFENYVNFHELRERGNTILFENNSPDEAAASSP
ncbi:hypothetical protein GF325_11080 [Candidatus Bathyarchaeota archaeon]|nr:hypothetical protein [Candidatus Bathyarchaeota archaeon]